MKFLGTGFLLFLFFNPNNVFLQCEINSVFFPQIEKEAKIELGNNVMLGSIARPKTTWDKTYKQYFYVGEADKKEIKNSDKINEGFHLFENKIYGVREISGIHIFENSSNIDEKDFLVNGIVNYKLEQIRSIDSLDSVVFTITGITADFIMLNSENGQFVCFRPDYNRAGMFKSAINFEELKLREKNTSQYLGKYIQVKSQSGSLLTGKLVSVRVDPYKTEITIETIPSSITVNYIIADTTFKIFDDECLNELRAIEEARLLQEKEEKLKIEEQQRLIDEGRVIIVETYDEFKQRTFFTDQRLDFYPIPSYASFKFNLYYSKSNNETKPNGLRIHLSYQSTDWLFIEGIYFLINGESTLFSTNFDGEVIGNGKILEEYDAPVSAKLLSVLSKVQLDVTVKLRLNGSKYYDELELNRSQKAGIMNLLKYYKSLGGQI